jgi:hypothetical protein
LAVIHHLARGQHDFHSQKIITGYAILDLPHSSCIHHHRSGAPQTQRFMFTVVTDFDKKKKMAKKLMGMKEE